MKDLIIAIINIFKYAGKATTILRNLFFNLLFLALVAIICITIFNREEASIENGTALLLSIQGNIVEEKTVNDPLSDFLGESLGLSNLPMETLLQDIIDSIHSAADDDRISSIVLDLSEMGTGSINQLRDIGDALMYFQDYGKQVIAAEDFYSQNKYFLASYADKVFLNPVGLIDLHGFSTYRLYFKDALDKLKINYHVFRVGTFKSALEPITRNSMSEEAKSQNNSWLNVLWREFSEDIVTRRGISRETLDLYTNNISELLRKTGGDTAQLALETKLIDELKTREELRSYLINLTGSPSDRTFRHVTFKEYLNEINRSYVDYSTENAVGIIVAQGNILTGDQPPGNIGSDSLVKVIREARTDNLIKAVVLRIDSGGGSVFASEIIRKELQELRKSGKTLVVSMGNMAASGGYWIAAEADEIWAHPTTLTGSIGIFGAVPTFENSLAHLGIYSDGTGTTAMSAGLNITQPLQPEVKKSIQLSIEHGYQRFLEIVAKGRDITPQELDNIAQGRVFDGITAKQIGLVDKLGNLEDAIASAATLEGLDNYSVRYIRSAESFTEKILKQLQSSASLSFINLQLLPSSVMDKLQFLFNSASNLTLFDDPKNIYAHCLINYY